jgi:hypothetical protein
VGRKFCRQTVGQLDKHAGGGRRERERERERSHCTAVAYICVFGGIKMSRYCHADAKGKRTNSSAS